MQWALIGASTIAAQHMIRAIRAHEGNDIARVVSSFATRGADYAREHRIPASGTDLDAALADPSIDAVSISTTNEKHLPHAMPSGIMFDMHREAAARRPGVLTRIGFDTFADPIREGCAMNAKAAARPIVRRVKFDGDTWLHLPNIVPSVCILHATTADEHGNLTYEHEGAYLGGLEQAFYAQMNTLEKVA